MSPLDLARKKALLDRPEPVKAMSSDSLFGVVNKAAFAWLLAALLSRYESESLRVESVPTLPAWQLPTAPASAPKVAPPPTWKTGSSTSYFSLPPHDDESSADEKGE